MTRVLVREEIPSDFSDVRRINESAFDTSAEACLVDTLREEASPIVSLVAVVDDEVVGHIMFSPVSIPGLSGVAMGLAPMAIEPARQRQGIGSTLVREGIYRCRERCVQALIVLGHPEYYPKFGFVPASGLGVRSEYDVPDEVFMAMELKKGCLDGIDAVASYHPAFGNL